MMPKNCVPRMLPARKDGCRVYDETQDAKKEACAYPHGIHHANFKSAENNQETRKRRDARPQRTPAPIVLALQMLYQGCLRTPRAVVERSTHLCPGHQGEERQDLRLHDEGHVQVLDDDIHAEERPRDAPEQPTHAKAGTSVGTTHGRHISDTDPK